MQRCKIGILGAGHIAATLADTMAKMPEAECYAVASRSYERAKSFAQEHGFEKAYGCYEELVQDPGVELIYIATPHSHHYAHMKLCIEHGKPVLCEKAFTMNGGQAERIRRLAVEKKVFAAEAMWTRYMPSRRLIEELLDSGVIGRVYALTANLSYVINHKERLMKPELAGGALLDVGVYGLNFALMFSGTDVERMESSVQMTETGVDGMETITLFYADGRMAVITAGLYARSDRQGVFYGDKGYMIVENINNPQSVSVYDLSDKLVKCVKVPAQISGYEYELRECMEAVRQGRTEAASMPLKDSVEIMHRMDDLRSSWGLVFPQERGEN